MQNNETPRFELNPHYLGAPVNVNQVVPSGYQVIDNATGQPGHVYYVKATHPTNQATVALDYDKDSFNYFSTNSKLPLVFDEAIGDGPIGAGSVGGVSPSLNSSSSSNSNTNQKTIQVYYDDNGNYVGPLQSTNGRPIIHILDDAGLNNIVAAQHMYDQNNAIRVPNGYYEGLMSSTPMLQDLTLLVFANMEPVQSSSSNIAV
ncbi:hypothetical protein ACLHIM_06575 [Ligilactobacillus sp. LYQ112]|uniref:hypothetical protein n=1 Tax=Ligilactobacillus sp. LYQ112 TaxID=3391060 RepID=UPI00398385C1